MKMYGIANCNTVKKARDWLARRGISVEFHDFKKFGVDAATVQSWLRQADWENLLNRKGQTWRGLPDGRKLAVHDMESALKLMLEKNSVIKRPILENNGKLVYVGFDEAAYSRLFHSPS
jgi:arsenate reductase